MMGRLEKGFIYLWFTVQTRNSMRWKNQVIVSIHSRATVILLNLVSLLGIIDQFVQQKIEEAGGSAPQIDEDIIRRNMPLSMTKLSRIPIVNR